MQSKMEPLAIDMIEKWETNQIKRNRVWRQSENGQRQQLLSTKNLNKFLNTRPQYLPSNFSIYKEIFYLQTDLPYSVILNYYYLRSANFRLWFARRKFKSNRNTYTYTYTHMYTCIYPPIISVPIPTFKDIESIDMWRRNWQSISFSCHGLEQANKYPKV